MPPVAGTSHDITLATATETVGFMLSPGSYFGPERLDDFRAAHRHRERAEAALGPVGRVGADRGAGGHRPIRLQ